MHTKEPEIRCRTLIIISLQKSTVEHSVRSRDKKQLMCQSVSNLTYQIENRFGSDAFVYHISRMLIMFLLKLDYSLYTSNYTLARLDSKPPYQKRYFDNLPAFFHRPQMSFKGFSPNIRFSEVFDDFLRSYLNNFAQKSLDTDQFKAYLLNYFKDNKQLKTIDWDSWLNHSGMPPIIPG